MYHILSEYHIKHQPDFQAVNSMADGRSNRRAVGYLTSRPGPMGLVIVLAIALLALFVIISIYFAIVSAANPAAIMMVLFFAVPLLFILGVEENAFPDLSKRKWTSVVAFYITGLFVIPIIGSIFFSFNVVLLLMLIIFGVPMVISAIHLATTEESWNMFKDNSKGHLSNAGARIKAPISRIRHRPRKEPKRRLKRNR